MQKSKPAKYAWKLAKKIFHWSWEIAHLDTRETLSEWSKLEEFPICRPSQFYDFFEESIKSRGISGVKLSRITLAEGGIFSPKRKYVRVRYQYLVYDICGFPHGRRGFFVSCRLSSVKVLPLSAKYGFLLLCVGIFGGLSKMIFGIGGILATVLLLIGVISSFRREASGASFQGLIDEILSSVPLVGTLYHSVVHPETVYGQDLQIAFRQSVQKALSHAISESTAPKASFKYEHSRTDSLF